MTNSSLTDSMENDIIPTELAIRAMRDSGYKNTAYALAELIDNSAQAGANLIEVFCIERKEKVKERVRQRISEIAVLDNGKGMTSDILRRALQFGNGTHLNDRSGIGRFGMGLPNSSISQGRRVEVWSWQNGPDNAFYSYLDIDEVEQKIIKSVPAPSHKPVPIEWRERGRGFGNSGTLIVWKKFEDDRLTWKGAKALLANSESLIGRMYRKFIHDGRIRIRLCSMSDDGVIFEQDARVNDPLYLMAPSSTPAPYDQKPMFQKWGEDDQTFRVEFNGKDHTVTVRASWALTETNPDDGVKRGSKDYGKHAAKNVGISIVRADRELDLDTSWTIPYKPEERWWGIEVDFPPELDEVFGVTNNKQAATKFSHMASVDLKDLQESGESFTDFKLRLQEDGDPMASLIDIVDYIKTQLPKIRQALEKQNIGTGPTKKRHDETSVEDRASTKFKERAAEKSLPSDNEVFDDKAQKGLVDDLVKNKSYSVETAKDIAASIVKRDKKVIFIETASDMDAFFGIEQKPGGITEIVFNRNHPAFSNLKQSLDADTSDSTDRELISRIETASETLKMLFAAWARQEIEDIPNRDRLRRMRQDWGRMAQDFLNDENE